MQHEEYRRCFEIYHLQTTFVVRQVTSAFLNTYIILHKKHVKIMYCLCLLHDACRFFIHDVNSSEATLTKLENSFILISLNRYTLELKTNLCEV